MYSQRSKYWPAYIWDIRTSYTSNIKGKISNEFNVSGIDFEKMYFNIFNKINDAFYHFESLKEAEEIGIQTGKELSKIKIPGTEGMIGIAGSPFEPIGYEYESCLISIKSALDFISILIAKGLNKNVDNIVALDNNIEQIKNFDSSTLEGEIYTLFKKELFKAFIDEYRGNKSGSKSKRNFATHDGPLPTGTINVPINNPNAEVLPSKALDINNPDPFSSIKESKNLIEYCEDQFYKLCDFFIEILSLISNNNFTYGPKKSVYEQKIEIKNENEQNISNSINSFRTNLF